MNVIPELRRRKGNYIVPINEVDKLEDEESQNKVVVLNQDGQPRESAIPGQIVDRPRRQEINLNTIIQIKKLQNFTDLDEI